MEVMGCERKAKGGAPVSTLGVVLELWHLKSVTKRKLGVSARGELAHLAGHSGKARGPRASPDQRLACLVSRRPARLCSSATSLKFCSGNDPGLRCRSCPCRRVTGSDGKKTSLALHLAVCRRPPSRALVVSHDLPSRGPRPLARSCPASGPGWPWAGRHGPRPGPEQQAAAAAATARA